MWTLFPCPNPNNHHRRAGIPSAVEPVYLAVLRDLVQNAFQADLRLILRIRRHAVLLRISFFGRR